MKPDMKKLLNIELNRLSVEEFRKASKFPVIVVLDNIRSLNNTGSVFRTSDAFLFEEVVLCGITGTPPHREIEKTALGATLSVKWEYFSKTEEAVKQLRNRGYMIISVEQTAGSVQLNNFRINKENKYAIVFGHEVKGVQQEVVDLSDNCIEIPQKGTKHSINIAVSAGIVLWEFFKAFQQGGIDEE